MRVPVTRTRRTIAWPLVCTGLLAAAVGCSEDTAVPVDDQDPPEVRLLYPPANLDAPSTIADSADVYIGAFDATAVARVELYYSRPVDDDRKFVGAVTSPVERGTIPDPVQPYITVPADWKIYTIRWRTGGISSGTKPQAFSKAYDAAGNAGVSPPLTVFVQNEGSPLLPPELDFEWIPRQGIEGQPILFDPKPGVLTYDQIDPPERIQIRWDFDGDADPTKDLDDDPTERGWEITWGGQVRANGRDIVSWTYETRGSYTVQAQARNTYLDASTHTPNDLRVTGEGGDPHPPNPNDFVMLPAIQTFRIGVDSAQVVSNNADQDEQPNFWVTLGIEAASETMIQRYETTNAIYLDYLNDGLSGAAPTLVRRADNRIYETATGRMIINLAVSRIFFDTNIEALTIQSGYEQHPVTGVSWFGADAYCIHWGLRLPTEAEWEVAAKGDSASWNYTWGRTVDQGDPTGGKARANFVDSGDPFPDTTPVMFFNGENYGGFQTIDTHGPYDGLRAIYDMAGNVAEWTNNWYGTYLPTTATNPRNNYSGPRGGVQRVIRGGSYLNTVRQIRTTDRQGTELLNEGFISVGFRPAYNRVPTVQRMDGAGR